MTGRSSVTHLRRLDRWTLTVFNPYYASDHRH